MRRAMVGLLSLLLLVGLGACSDDDVTGVDGSYPAPPENLAAWYYNQAVYITWELAPTWDNDSFRVYAKRSSDPDYFRIAEVTSCTEGVCSYTDINIVPDVTYEYYVAAVSASGLETPSDFSVEVYVPSPVPPPEPSGMEAVALDQAVYLRWDANARDASDFSFYRVYLSDVGGDTYLLGETDSEGFLDRLAANGTTYSYFVTAVDDQGHESEGSALASATPRPDYHGEWIYAYEDVPSQSGFRFPQDELTLPILSGDSPDRQFRLEIDAQGWWLVPGPGTEIYDGAFETTALKCGVDSDFDCTALDLAPTTGYTTLDISLSPQLTYVLRVVGDDGQSHYGAVRTTLLGFDQDGAGIMIFDWAYQLQAGSPNLAPQALRGR